MQYCNIRNDSIEEKLQCYFERIKTFFSKEYNDQISVMLIGSLSRGEGTWIEFGGKPKLISDIEFFIIYENNIDKVRIGEQLKLIELSVFGLEHTNMFHIDFSFLRKSNMPKMEKRLIIYESSIFGVPIFGADCRNLLPKITIDNVNLYDIKDIINNRIFSILYYGKWKKSSLSEDEYRYTIGKNGLDLLTAYLCNKGILEAGFIRRLKRLEDVDINAELKQYFKECGRIKLDSLRSSKLDIGQAEKVFLYTAKKLESEFIIKKRNIVLNLKSIIRRIAGILKRAIKLRCLIILSPRKHFEKMTSALENGWDDKLQIDICKQHYILYGFQSEFIN